MRRRHLLLVLVGVTALVLAGTAFAAIGRAHSKHARPALARHLRGPGDDLQAAASYLDTTTDVLLTQLRAGKTLAQIADSTSGKSASGLIAALVAHEKQELAAAVKAGRLTQTQSDAIGGTLEQRFTRFVDGLRPAFGARPRPGGGFEAAAKYLGISVQSLVAQLRTGKTLAQIANATSGKSADGLIDALVADATARFGGSAPADLRARIAAFVNGTLRFQIRPPAGPFGFGGHRYAPMMPRGRNI